MKKIKLLWIWLLAFLWLTAFWYCSFEQYYGYFLCSDTSKRDFNWNTNTPTDIWCNDIEGVCYWCFSSSCPSVRIYDSNWNVVINSVERYAIFCWTWLKYTNSSSNTPWVYLYTWMVSECPTCQECQECWWVDTWSILSWYIAISDVTTNYCVSNDLCPIYSWSRSELVINNIAHEWRPLINISIPDYITWDYSVNNNQYDIYVWSWYDQDYIDSVLAINSYRPDSGDFTNIFVSWLTLIFPYIFLALLIIFMWKLLKRIFK